MGKKRVLVGYGIDVDAAANWLNTTNGSPTNPSDVSRGVYGATVGIDRLLKLFEKYNIKASWYVPAHSIESFPKQLAKVRDGGHEIGLHGYTHEHFNELSESEQRKVMLKSIDVLTRFCGKKPLGFTAPSWLTSKELIPILEECGILYDHSFMHHDVQPYYAPTGKETWVEVNINKPAEEWMRPLSTLKPSKIVEIPANWHLDDWPPMQPKPGAHGFVDPHVVERFWMDQFDFAYREYDEFIFPMSIHPQVSGKPQIVLMHERIIEHINKHEGVEWVPFCQMAQQFKDGKIKGATLEGGVDI